MSAWHDPDRTVVDAFLVKSQFRPGSVPTYRWFLRTFEDVARRPPAVDRQMLEAWLKEMARRWRMSTLLNQVCIVDRFLDHLAELGLKIGRASCRDRVSQYGLISCGAVQLNKTQHENYTNQHTLKYKK